MICERDVFVLAKADQYAFDLAKLIGSSGHNQPAGCGIWNELGIRRITNFFATELLAIKLLD